MSKRAKSIIGICVIVFLLVSGILWNTVLRTVLSSVNVYVLKNSVSEGESITADNVIVRSISRTDLIAGSITSMKDAQQLLNLNARQYIPAGAQLVSEYFQKPELVLKEGQFIFAVPSEWIIAMPDTIRRNDTAYFYAFSTTQAQMLMSGSSLPGATPTATAGLELITPAPSPVGSPSATNSATASPSATISPLSTATPEPSATNGIANVTNDLLNSILEGKQYQVSAVIAYCKDKSNHEIVDSGATVDDRLNRLTGSGQISNIEIIATEEQIDMLQKAVMQGYKFIVLYK